MIARPFDAAAEHYDRDFTETRLGRFLRGRVWKRLAHNFHAGDRVLELNCGTGEDALWLARQGVHVMATDVSRGMLLCAGNKIAAAGLSKFVRFASLDLAAPEFTTDSLFDGAYSNFGGLNCVQNLEPLASVLAESVRPRGSVVLVLMYRFCLWEILWELVHLHRDRALRRVRSCGTCAEIGGISIPVWYPRIRSVRQVFGRTFELKSARGLGVFLPPSYLAGMVSNDGFYAVLTLLERSLASLPPFSRWGDHIILEFERRPSNRAPGGQAA